MNKVRLLSAGLMLLVFTSVLMAQEVGKGYIPNNHIVKSYKKLPWGASIWDAADAISFIQSKKQAIWVDTRPASFLKKGTVKNAVNLLYDKQGNSKNQLTQKTLDNQLIIAGLSKKDAKIIFFCQGPKCHRSYNATYVAVKKWGYNPENIVWFREGFPQLKKIISTDRKLVRKTKQFIQE